MPPRSWKPCCTLKSRWAAAATATLLHIPCPNGHVLETPSEMIDQRVMCPECRVEYYARRERSLEQQVEREAADEQRTRLIMQIAILAGCFVAVILIVMCVIWLV